MYAKLFYLIIATFAVSILIVLYYSSLQSEEIYVKLIEEHDIEPSSNDLPQKLYDILDFKYVLNNKSLCTADTETLILVTSYFGNVEARSAMRRAFSREELDVMKIKRAFLLGIAPSDKYTSQKSVLDESRRFGDIIQGSFVEAYRNLTYKHTMGLRWAEQHCSNVKQVIKMDDDIVVNVEKIPDLLKSLGVPSSKNFIAGYVLRNMVPIREPANKWFVTQEEYDLSTYPPFVSGWFYVTNPYTCANLFNISQSMKYFWIDDTLITGILAEKLSIQHVDIKANFTLHSEILECCINDIRSKNLRCDILIGPNGGKTNLFYDFNTAIGICNLNLCPDRTVPLDKTCIVKRKETLGRGNPIVENYRLS
ncbi:unnamed protein product [Acanthoscelides obtectus]|uniref:Hexosyltransferase n=1 Tax=Acanthoscelides obtectus TaxID=200917 RepID=A0A9P0L6X5_ACAOB